MGHTSPGHDEQHDIHSRGLKLLKDCPVCQRAFESTDVRVVDTSDNVHLLHLTCQSCDHALLSLFTISHAGMSSVGMATDLSHTDADRLLGSAPISEEEMLSLHTLLFGDTYQHRQVEDLFITRL